VPAVEEVEGDAGQVDPAERLDGVGLTTGTHRPGVIIG
jgi:hypothetical protein